MLNAISTELHQLKDLSTHQKRRITEMLSNLMKDLAEIGVSFGNDIDLKVSLNLNICKTNHF